MNSMKIFNFKYMYQNLKKSKSIIILIFILFPILSASVIMNNPYIVITLKSLIIINILGMIIPILLSYILFGFVYKKNSSDFVNSMPISRKRLFFSNTFLGIFIIFSLLIINIILIFMTSNFVNAILPFKVIIDYFILWFSIYTFIFVISNLSMSLSGNEITSLILSVLIIAFVPFVSNYIVGNITHDTQGLIRIDNNKIKDELYKVMDEELINGEDIYDFSSNVDNNITNNFLYTKIINFVLGTRNNLYVSNKEIILMFILSIIYIILGYYSFNNRKMEVSETSFKSYKIHTLIKCLTLTPFIVLFWAFLLETGFRIDILILFIFIIGYYYVYDLITKKGINFKKSLLYFLVFIFISFSFVYLVHKNKKYTIIFNLNDIKSVSLKSEEFNFYNIKDKDIINSLIVEKIKKNFVDSSLNNNYIKFKIGNKIITCNIDLEKEYLDNLKNILKEKHLSDKIISFNTNNAIAISIDGESYKIKEFKDLKKYENINSNKTEILKLYYYDKVNHEVFIKDTKFNKETKNYVVSIHNDKNIKRFKKLKKIKGDIDISTELHNLDKITMLDTFKIRYQLFDYLKNIKSNNLDLTKPYLFFTIYYKNKWFYIYDNNIDEFKEFLKNLGMNMEDINIPLEPTIEVLDEY